MPLNKSNIIFIGNAGGLCGYLFRGVNIVRKSSSLTTKRVAEEPAFEGFRNSGNRMKQASPIAASLYNLLSKEQKVYPLYRKLTGEALKMIKQGIGVEMIVARLKEQYINPVLEGVANSKNQSLNIQTYSDRSTETRKSFNLSADLFKPLPYNRDEKRRVRVKRIIQYSDIGSIQLSLTEEKNSKEDTGRNNEPVSISFHPSALTKKQKKESQLSAFIYMGRLKEWKGLRMWLRPC